MQNDAKSTESENLAERRRKPFFCQSVTAPPLTRLTMLNAPPVARQPLAAPVVLSLLLAESWRLSSIRIASSNRCAYCKHSANGKIKHRHGVFALWRCVYMPRLKNDCRQLKMANRTHCYFSVDYCGVAILADAVSRRFWRL